MAWDDKPPTEAELKATAPVAAPETTWDAKPPTAQELGQNSTPFGSMGDSKVNELLKTGFNFDTFQKLNPEEKKQYEDLSAQHAEVFQNAAKLGASSGLSLGFKKDLFNTPQDLEKAQSALPQDQQALAGKEASAGGMAGNLVGGAPVALATGGATGLATKGISTAAELGPLATRAVQGAGNVLSGAAIGEAQGIANSNAPTLTEKAQEALPVAALGAGLGVGAEALAAAPQLAETALQKVQPAVQNSANKFAFNSLKPTGSDIAKVNAQPGLKNEIGQYLLQNDLVKPLSSQQDIAQNVFAAKQAAGQQVGSATQSLDEAVAKTFTKPGADVPEINPSAMENIKPNQPNDVESAGLDIQDPNNTPQAGAVQSSQTQPQATNLQQTEQQLGQKIASQPTDVQQKVQQILQPGRIADELSAQIITPITKAGDAANIAPVLQEQISKFANIQDPSLSNLFKYRQQLDDAINFNRNPLTGQETPVSKALKTYRSAVDEKLMDAAKQVDDLTGAGAYDALVQGKKDYSIASRAGNIAQRSAAQQESAVAKSAIPATGAAIGKGAAMLAGSGGTVVPALAGAATLYAGKKYGNQFAATSLNQLSQLLETSPQVLGEFAAPLQDAAKRGSTALSAMNYALYQSNPAYRAKIDPLQEEAEKQAQ